MLVIRNPGEPPVGFSKAAGDEILADADKTKATWTEKIKKRLHINTNL